MWLWVWTIMGGLGLVFLGAISRHLYGIGTILVQFYAFFQGNIEEAEREAEKLARNN